jgi:ATP-dependent Clp protease ATP-binding subunit ClpX
MKENTARCSFCRKSHTDAGPLVEGPEDVYICRECIELCQAIIDQEQHRREPSRPPVGAAFIREKLDQVLSGQDEAKQILALAADSRSEGGGRVLLLGPSSSAKIVLARALAQILEVPFAAGDSSGLVPSKHDSMAGLPLLLRLLQASEFDVEKAQRGVVFVDGAERPDTQEAMLRLWQEKAYYPVEGLRVPVNGMLFVCGASFVGLEEGIARSGRHAEQPVRVEDLTGDGVRPDWAGCLAGIARVTPLDEASLVRLVQWVDFRCYNDQPEEYTAPSDSGGKRTWKAAW